MKAAAIDCSSNYLNIAVCNGDMTYTSSCNLGLQHSSNIVPSLDTALAAVNLAVRDIDFIACPHGPGSFTGLRLAFAAAKAVQMAANIPLITIPTLDIWAQPFSFWKGLVLSCIDGKKKQFYVTANRGGQKVSDILDIPPERIVSFIDPEEHVLITGPDAALLTEKLESIMVGTSFFCADAIGSLNSADILLRMAAQQYSSTGQTGIDDYQGPLYIRKSEAEEALEAKTS